MANISNLDDIIKHILDGTHTYADRETLRQLLASGDRETISQLGKYNVNIKEGKDIHIGDRIYQQWDKEAIEALVKTIQENAGIHQHTQGGDAAARDIDKSTTIFQFFFSGNEFQQTSSPIASDLDLSDISEDTIQQAYQDSLPPYAEDWGLSGNSIQDKINALQQFGRLSDFFDRLIQNEDLPLPVRDRLRSTAKQLAAKKSPETTKNRASPNPDLDRVEPKSYLIATLIPDDSDRYRFLLNAWLIADDSVRDLSKFQSLLDPDEQQQGKLCKLDRVPIELNQFLKKALRYLRGKRFDLTIEIFLPSQLMCMEIDRWKISDPVDDEITLGVTAQA